MTLPEKSQRGAFEEGERGSRIWELHLLHTSLKDLRIYRGAVLCN